eukprot:gnl/MRDRNA2_/MRDRNA2_14790_c0_seq1.p1 gnl/MRDRNA2_/MRDRNA2_14790_c0~~gnl/MRDRNA2_/MRDRNA2_14790_c0_seq1.p1  ORF type:complete len:668 (+),score=91.52 gnl/MRDRNA2_/MRDRNA2_14790_c0_seq1:145-2148(+)
MIEELFPLAITFPRQVRIENTRLTLMYWCFVLGASLYMLVTFVVTNGHYFEQTPGGTVQFWPRDWNPSEEQIAELNAIDDEKDHCTSPEKYEFCDDPECSWAAKELTCMNICSGSSGEDCMEAGERFIKTADSLFFPTFFAESSTVRSGDMRIGPEKKWRIIKGVESMGIGFQHDYYIHTPGSVASESRREEGSSRSSGSSDGDGLLTVLEDQDGNEIERWEPGQRMTLTLKKILQAGKISLDSIYYNEDTMIGKNFLEGAQIPNGILMRLAGAEITLELSYHNRATSRTAGWSGPVCYLKIHSLPVWTSNPVSQVVDGYGSQRFRYYQGLRVRFKTTGTFAWVSLEHISNKITQLLVLVACIKTFFMYFTAYSLGVVSQVYRGFIFQSGSVGKEACALAARIISHTSTFVELQDTPHGISKEQILRRFKIIFANNPEFGEGEIQRFAHFVFHRIGKVDKNIDVEDFSQACSHGEALHFTTMVDLFDADRKKSFLERTFAGPTMRQVFKSDEAARDHEGLEVRRSWSEHAENLKPSQKAKIFGAIRITHPTRPSQNGIPLTLTSTSSPILRLDDGRGSDSTPLPANVDQVIPCHASTGVVDDTQGIIPGSVSGNDVKQLETVLSIQRCVVEPPAPVLHSLQESTACHTSSKDEELKVQDLDGTLSVD